MLVVSVANRVGVEAKDTKKIQGQGQLFRGQGQDCWRPRTKDTAASVLQIKKQKSFSGHLQFIGVARIFDWGLKLQITCNDVIKNFQKRNFLSDKYIVGGKI